MEVVLIIFMVLVGLVSIFSLVVVILDIIKERKNKAQAIAAPQCACCNAEVPVAEEKAAENTAERAESEPLRESVVTVDENSVVFSAGEQKTLEEKFQQLDPQLQKYYVEIVQYAMSQSGAKQFKNAKYEEYRIGKTRLVRMQIKRGVVVCEFILLNSDFRNYIQDNKVHVRQSPTVLRVENEEALAAAKSSIDIAVKAAADETEYRKQRQREKRRQARQERLRAEQELQESSQTE